ncbi:MAG: hypothetical protein Mars2KO_11780 [Maribacter sp.]
MKEIKISWIEKGYRTFAIDGPNGLKIEHISREVGKNKSSFYQLFANLKIFTSILLDYHLERSKLIAEKESKCSNLQDLVDVLIEHKVDLLFNRQLRVHRENAEFEKCFLRVNEMSIPAIIPIWSTIIGLDDNSYLAELVFRLSLENFFLQITDETLNGVWLKDYVHKIQILVSQFKKTGTIPLLDGGV